MDYERRRLLRLAGLTTASTIGVAGCLDSIGGNGDDDGDADNGGDDPDDNATETASETSTDEDEETESTDELEAFSPVYRPWLATDGDELQFASITASALEDRPLYEEATAASQTDDVDPMVRLPLIGVITGIGGLRAAEFNTSLDRIVGGYEDGGDFAADDLETTIDRFLAVDDSFVFFGDVDTDEITAILTEPENSYATEFERVDEREVFDVYQPVDAESESAHAFAVGDDAIVLSTTDDDPVAAMGRLLDARIDGVGRATDDFSDLGWLLETAGEGEVVFADHTRPDTDQSADGELTGFLGGLTYEGETRASSDLGMAFTRLPAERESALKELYGNTADDVSFEFGDDRLAASATWADVDAVLPGDD